MYPTVYFEDDRSRLDVCFLGNRLYGEIDGEKLSNNELINCINSLNEIDTVKLIKECGGPKKLRHAYRRLLWESPVKILDRELKENNSSLEEYLELSYRAGLNPLPALRAKGVIVRFGQNIKDPHFTNEDIIVTYDSRNYVTIAYNPWNRETEKNIVNKGLQFQLENAARLKEFNDRFEPVEPKKRVIRKKIIKYSED